MAGIGLGLGAGLSGFAQGFASSFVTAQEQKQRDQLDEKKNMREMLVKHVLDPNNPIDLTGEDSDPSTKKMVAELFGHAAPLFEKLSARNSEHVYQLRMQEHQARTTPVAPGESRTIKTGYGTETIKGAPLPTPGETPEEKVDLARRKAQAVEEVKEPGRLRADERRQAREQRAEKRRVRNEVRTERKQYRDEVRRTAIKLGADPKMRTFSRRLKDWWEGRTPDQYLSEALADIPSVALPPKLQEKQTEGTSSPAAGGRRSTAASEADAFLRGLSAHTTPAGAPAQ